MASDELSYRAPTVSTSDSLLVGDYDYKLDTAGGVEPTPFRPRNSELPIETEIDPFQFYITNTPGAQIPLLGRIIVDSRYESESWDRLERVARYEPAKPEVKEPTGLGAVVCGADNRVWIRTNFGRYPWVSGGMHVEGWRQWSELLHPVQVLSEGTEVDMRAHIAEEHSK